MESWVASSVNHQLGESRVEFKRKVNVDWIELVIDRHRRHLSHAAACEISHTKKLSRFLYRADATQQIIQKKFASKREAMLSTLNPLPPQDVQQSFDSF